MFSGIFQMLGYGVQMNIKSRSRCNPGLAKAVLLHLPLAAYYIAHVSSLSLVSRRNWFWGAVAFVVGIALIVVLPVQ